MEVSDKLITWGVSGIVSLLSFFGIQRHINKQNMAKLKEHDDCIKSLLTSSEHHITIESCQRCAEKHHRELSDIRKEMNTGFLEVKTGIATLIERTNKDRK